MQFILFLFSLWIHNLWCSLSTITLGSWKDPSNYDSSNTEWQESENGFGKRELRIKILVLLPVGSANLQPCCSPPRSLTFLISRRALCYFPDSGWTVNAKHPAQRLVHAQHVYHHMGFKWTRDGSRGLWKLALIWEENKVQEWSLIIWS